MQRSSRTLFLEALEQRALLSTCHVTRLADSGGGFGFRGDLRYCINKVNDNPGADAIDFRVTGTINLNSALPDLASDIDIQGPGADQLTVRGETFSDYRILHVLSNARVRVSGLSLTNGNHPQGSGVYNAGNLRLEACTIAFNGGEMIDTPTIYGGGIYNLGTLSLDRSTVSNNRAQTETFDTDNAFGGGIYNAGTLTVRNSTISDNLADSFDGESRGAGIANAGTLSVRFSAGDNTDAPEFDQRGMSTRPNGTNAAPGSPRIVNDTIDIGAFEVQATGAPLPAGARRGSPDAAVFITANLENELFNWRL